MTGKARVPELSDMLDSKQEYGPCAYVRRTTPEQRAAIEEYVDKRRWAKFSQWLQLQGVDLVAETIARHYRLGHSDDA